MKKSFAYLASALLAASFAAPTAAQVAELTWSGGQLGASITYDLTGDAGQLYGILPSTILTTTPLPGGTLNIGLDQLSLLTIGGFSGAGQAQNTFSLPATPALAGVGIHAQFATFPGPGVLIDEVSNRVTFVAGFPNTVESTFGNAQISRVGHTLTALGDGRVLLAGGAQNSLAGSFPTTSIEVYDRDVQEFVGLAGTLTTARTAHTATLLDDGRVLLIGGVGSSTQPLASVEIFDPNTNTSSAAASMSSARTQHTATKLADGRVLVVAGTSFFDTNDIIASLQATLQSSEIYNPVSNSWTSGPDLPISGPYGAIGQAASLMNDGRVLVTGGVVVGSLFSIPLPAVASSAWRYAPGSNSWVSTASMSTVRVYHGQATMPDGRVLVVGGADANFTSLTATTKATCERYGTGNSWSSVPSLNQARAYPVLLDAGDGLVVVGGLASADLTTVSGVPAQLIETSGYGLSSWASGPSTMLPRELIAATVLDGGDRVLITGASLSSGLDTSAEQLLR